ncbi:hypothetical protein SEA_HONK_36 [Microbacterium phage Honk]|uniref:Uncharacterized protein n=1 Tax=Microbacterium phage Honk TaxID=2836095 RepID=A0A8F3E9Z3_9CAUD|nr:hypothetical protein SEA_HONK_36 [Microbacterium phage Honk]
MRSASLVALCAAVAVAILTPNLLLFGVMLLSSR